MITHGYAAAAAADAARSFAPAFDYDGLLDQLLGKIEGTSAPPAPADSLPALALAAGFADPDDPAVVALSTVLAILVEQNADMLARRLEDDEIARVAEVCEVPGDAIERRALIEAALSRLKSPGQKASAKSARRKGEKAEKGAKAPVEALATVVVERGGEAVEADVADAPAKPAEEAKPKAARAPKAEAAPDWRPANPHAVALAGVPLQDRTKLIGLPATLLWEGVGGRGERNRHQADHSRPEPFTPVMPCLLRLSHTGNPYPDDPNDASVRPHGEQYRPFVRISHRVWADLAEHGGERDLPNDDWARTICSEAGVPWTKDARACVTDTLRDLACVGLLVQEVSGGRRRRFRKA